MDISLSDLVNRLQDDVPARDSVPTDAQYERCVKDAVAAFSRKCGRVKIATLSVVSGTATYDLPADFVKLIRLERLTTPDNVIVSGEGLIPVSATYEERWTIADGQITFYPTPTYTLARDIEYVAGWVLGSGDSYAELGDAEAEVFLKLAASRALGMQANKVAQEAWQYAIGDERVSKEKLAGELARQSKDMLDAYNGAVGDYNSGTIGRRATYNRWEYS